MLPVAAAAALVSTGALDHAFLSEFSVVRQLLSPGVAPPPPLWTDPRCSAARNASRMAGDSLLEPVHQVRVVRHMDAVAAVAHAGLGLAFQDIVRSAGRAIDIDGQVEVEEDSVLTVESGVQTGGMRVRPGGVVFADAPRTLVRAAEGRMDAWQNNSRNMSMPGTGSAEDAINRQLSQPSALLRWALGLGREGSTDGALMVDVRTMTSSSGAGDGSAPSVDGVVGSTGSTLVADDCVVIRGRLVLAGGGKVKVASSSPNGRSAARVRACMQQAASRRS